MKKDYEELLLSQNSLDELIKKKMEEEIINESKKYEACKKEVIITDIKKVPKNIIFSKKTVFKVFNRENKTLSFINGLQAESMIGMQKSIYEKLKNCEIEAFSTDTDYIKFEKAKL